MTDETLNLIEEQIRSDLGRLDEFNDDQTKRSKAVQDLAKLMEKLTEAENARDHWYDNQERRRIDENRNSSSAEIEKLKQNLDWKRLSLEIAKITIPVFVPLIIWRKSFVEMVTFEETGRFTSSASRELHLPKIFNK